MSFKGLPDRSQFPHSERVLTTVDGHVGLIELNEPERLNPLGISELHLHYALEEMRVDANVRVVILTGRGRAFCAGRDLRSGGGMSDYDGESLPTAQRLLYGYGFGRTLWNTLHEFPKPIIAAVNGYAIGGGWVLAHQCDWILAAESAVFGSAEIDVGVPPLSGTCAYLARMVGKHLAMDLIVSGRRLTARDAYGLRLVNDVVPDDQLMESARTLAADVATRPPMTVAAIKQIFMESEDVMAQYKFERALGYYVQTLDDTKAAASALAHKQPRPAFDGH